MLILGCVNCNRWYHREKSLLSHLSGKEQI
ncbi:MAG TPA: hypothetical protein DEH25_11375 [Chloroflexi bacterium]|nr:hypothetical protein [Chloroflexota bacterium]HBY07117.1 hypothetical protein [Chloroflexota bacterium]